MKRFKQIRNILLAILILNWGVAFAKIVYGLISRSLAMTADGFHSLSDGASNIIGLIGIYIASRPTDKTHPYGHKKYETYASIAIAVILFLISINLLREVVSRFVNPVVPSVTVISFVVMAVTMIVNFFVMTYERRVGHKLKSDILVADSVHTKSDILASSTVIAALVATELGMPAIDLAAGIFIAILIARCALEIVKESSNVLCDGIALDSQLVRSAIKDISEVKRCHKIRTRGRPDDIHVDLHVSLNPNTHLDKAHLISHKIQDKIKEKIPGVTDVIVHIEPEKVTGTFFKENKK